MIKVDTGSDPLEFKISRKHRMLNRSANSGGGRIFAKDISECKEVNTGGFLYVKGVQNVWFPFNISVAMVLHL